LDPPIRSLGKKEKSKGGGEGELKEKVRYPDCTHTHREARRETPEKTRHQLLFLFEGRKKEEKE